ncbi:MAG TPA: glycosyltransferase family A protein [Gemmatimonadaceae bacterium]|nr:glycosyltransferase family A protein [Gemmatimonadaceae bacterium]
MTTAAERFTVSVIVPTTALAPRRALIWRAIKSILDQRGVRAVPTVIVNGTARDAAVVRELKANRRLRVRVLEQASLPNALQAGRRVVDTPWFAELDDDDVLLPRSLISRVEALLRSPGHDCVVANGYRRVHGEDTLNVPDMRVVERDPIRAFWERNWLLPGSYLCRTDRVGPDVFDGMPPSLECSYIALRLATSYRMRFLQDPTVIWNVHTPGSLSKSREWILSNAQAHERLLLLGLPRYAQQKVRERITSDCHSAANLYLSDGNRLEAWRWHLRSLVRRGGHRFVPFTWRLLGPVARAEKR